MTSEELAALVFGVCIEAGARIKGVGHEQYAIVTDSVFGIKQVQRTEIETLDQHLNGLEEELLDTINHAAMTVLKLRGMREEANRTTPR